MKSQFPKNFALAVMLTFAVLFLAPQIVSAHAKLIKADPAPGSVLGTAPTQVALFYDEEVDVGFSDIQVLDKNLARVDNGDLKTAPADPRQLVITVKPLGDGTYTVTWKVLSNTDGHVTRGNFAFSVGNVAGPVVAPGVPTTGSVSETDPLSVIVRWLNLLALLALVGAFFFYVVLLERSLRAVRLPVEAEARVRSGWKRLALVAFVIAQVTTAAGLFLEASLAAGVPLATLASGDALSRTLLQTRFGALWIARMILLIAVGLQLIARYRSSHLVGTVLGLGLLVTISLGGHSAAAGGVISLALAADWLHLIGVAVWVGGLFSFFSTCTILWRNVEAEKRARWIAWVVPQFSAVAIPATAVIAATGLYNSLAQIPTFDSLVSTAYGDTLSIKVALFLVMTAFGAVNLVLLSARFRSAADHPETSGRLFTRFRLTIGAEVVLGIGAIFLAGLLTLEPPARATIEEQNLPGLAQDTNAAARSGILLVDNAAPDVQVSLTVTPTLENPTTFDVYLTNPTLTRGTPEPRNGPTGGAPITQVLRLILQFTLLDQDAGITSEIAQAKGDGHYVVSGNKLTLPGMWKIHTIVRRAGVEDVAVDFPVYREPPKAQVGENSAEALQELRTSEAMMNRLLSLRSKQDLNDGSNGVVVTEYDYRSPDAMRFDVQGGASSIAIGAKQYYQDQEGTWAERARVDPFVFPQFDASTQAKNVKLGRLDIVNGKEAQIVRYVIPDAGGGEGTQFAQWISRQDSRLIQMAMVAPSHYMMQYYMDYDSPQIAVEAPANVVQPTPTAPAAPVVAAAPITNRAKGPITGDLEADAALGIMAAGVIIGLAASGRTREKRARFVLLVVSLVAIVGSIGLAVDAFSSMAAAVANAPIDSSLAAQGKPLYDANCATCHGATGHGDGPAGKSLPVQPFDLTTHVLLHDEQYLDAVISNGRGYMPAWKDRLAQDQIFNIIAYTRQLAQDARRGNLPGFTPGAGGGFTPQP